MFRKSATTVLVVFSLITAGGLGAAGAAPAASDPRQACIDCHQKETPGLVNQGLVIGKGEQCILYHLQRCFPLGARISCIRLTRLLDRGARLGYERSAPVGIVPLQVKGGHNKGDHQRYRDRDTGHH